MKSIYISKSGLDTNPGTKTKPILTLEKAIELSKEGKKSENIIHNFYFNSMRGN